MEAPLNDLFVPYRIVMGPGSRERLSPLVSRCRAPSAAIIADTPARRAGVVSEVERLLKGAGTDTRMTLTIPAAPLTEEVLAKRAGELAQGQVALSIAVGGAAAMGFAALCGREPGVQSAGLAVAPTILIPTTPMAAAAAVLPLALAWNPVREEMKLVHTGEGYPHSLVLDPGWCLDTVRIHAADPGITPLALAIETLLYGNADPFADALAAEAVRRLRPRILPAAGGSEEESCWQNLLVGGLMAGLAYGRCNAAQGWALTQALAHVYHLNPSHLMGMLLPHLVRVAANTAPPVRPFAAHLWGAGSPGPVASGRQFLDRGLGAAGPALPPSLESLREWIGDALRTAAPDDLKELGRYTQRKAHEVLDSLQFIDQWSARQSLQSAAADLQTLNRQIAFLMDRPLNLRSAGVTDNLAKLSRVIALAQEIHCQLAPQGEFDSRRLEEWVYAAYRARQGPLEVDPHKLH